MFWQTSHWHNTQRHSSSKTKPSILPLDCPESLSLGQAIAIVHENLSMGPCKENRERMLKTQWWSGAYTLYREWAFYQSNILVKSEVLTFVWNIKCQFPKSMHIIYKTQTEPVFIFLWQFRSHGLCLEIIIRHMSHLSINCQKERKMQFKWDILGALDGSVKLVKCPTLA